MAYTVTVKVNGVDYTDETVERLSIVYGRTSVTQDPTPTTCSATLLHSSAIGTVSLTDVAPNNVVTIQVEPSGYTGAANTVRFVGVISDVAVDRNTVSFNAVASGMHMMNRVTCSSWNTFGSFDADTRIPGVPQRAIANLYNAAIAENGLNPVGSETPILGFTVPIFPIAGTYSEEYNGDPVFIGGRMQAYAYWMRGGAVWETFAYGPKAVGAPDEFHVALELGYPTTSTTPALTLTNDETDFLWAGQTDAALTCTVAVVNYAPDPYGTPAAGTETIPPAGTVIDENARFGALSSIIQETDCKLTSLEPYDPLHVNPTQLASYIAARGYRPGPVLQVVMPLSTYTSARVMDILGELVGNRLWELPQLHPDLATLWYVQGYTETVGRNTWTVNVRLASLGTLWIGQPWMDVTSTLEWDDVPTSILWADLVEEIL